jgi:Fructose-2,6-bisphosphatase
MKLTTASLVTLLLNTSGTSLGFSFNAPLSTLSSCIVATTRGTSSIATFGIQPKPFRNDNDAVMTSSKAKSHLCSASQDMFSILDDLSTVLSGPDLPPVPLKSKRLFLVRHGEVINPGGDRPVYYGSQDVKLSPLGELEAKVRKKVFMEKRRLLLLF